MQESFSAEHTALLITMQILQIRLFRNYRSLPSIHITQLLLKSRTVTLMKIADDMHMSVARRPTFKSVKDRWADIQIKMTEK